MDGETPYAPPGSPVGGPSDAPGAGAIEVAAKTRPWITFIAVLASIATGFILLAAVFLGAAMMLGGSLGEEAGAAVGGVAMGLAVMVAYGLGGLIYLIVTVKLWKMRGAIAAFIQAASEQSLEEMLRAHLGFWRTIGFLAAIVLGLYVVGFGLALVLGIFAGLAAGG